MAKAKGIKLPHFKIPLFEHATVFFCPTREMFYEFCEKAGIPIEPDFELAGGLTLTCTGENGGNFYVIAVFNNELGTLVHECAHTTFHVLSDVGVVATTDPTNPANETYAYMAGRIFDAFPLSWQNQMKHRLQQCRRQKSSIRRWNRQNSRRKKKSQRRKVNVSRNQKRHMCRA